MKSSRQHDLAELERQYRGRYNAVLPALASALEGHVSECVKDRPRIDRVTARAKGVSSFIKKASKSEDGVPKYGDPIREIQDQVAARIVTFYKSDVIEIDNLIRRYFTSIESKIHVPDSEWSFGYFGKHYILIIPSDILDDDWEKEYLPRYFELQIKTLFQHAWSEAEHDVGYKEVEGSLDIDQKRLLALTSAQAWGADRIFDEIFLRMKNK